MKLLKEKKGDLIGNIFIIVLGAIIFFALYPAMSNILDIGVSMHAGDSNAGFLILAIPYVILIGMVVWVYRTITGGGASE